MKGKAKRKGIYKKEASQIQPAKKKKRNKEQRKFLCLLRGKGNSLPQSLYIGSAYKIKKEKGLPFIYNQQRNVMSQQISL